MKPNKPRKMLGFYPALVLVFGFNPSVLTPVVDIACTLLDASTLQNPD
ncbi:hypothetical protein [Nostoc sp.]